MKEVCAEITSLSHETISHKGRAEKVMPKELWDFWHHDKAVPSPHSENLRARVVFAFTALSAPIWGLSPSPIEEIHSSILE